MFFFGGHISHFGVNDIPVSRFLVISLLSLKKCSPRSTSGATPADFFHSQLVTSLIPYILLLEVRLLGVETKYVMILFSAGIHSSAATRYIFLFFLSNIVKLLDTHSTQHCYLLPLRKDKRIPIPLETSYRIQITFLIGKPRQNLTTDYLSCESVP